MRTFGKRTLVTVWAAACLLVLGVCAAGCPPQVDTQDPMVNKKAEVFYADLQRNYVIDGQTMCKLRLPTAGQPNATYNMPDNAYMTGIYTGMLAMKYAATKDEATLEDLGKALDALNLLCTVSGKPGLLARAAVPLDAPFNDDGIWRISGDGKYKWRGDVSSDQMDGVFFGYALAYDLAANEAQKVVIRKNVAALVDHLLDNDLRIIGYDGKPTTWGSYYRDYVYNSEPMNALLLLQHLTVAIHTTGEQRFIDAFNQQAYTEVYKDLVPMSRLDRPGAEANHSDDVLIWLALYTVLRLEHDPGLLNIYKQALQRAWDGGQYPGLSVEPNPLYAFTVAAILNRAGAKEIGIMALEQFPIDMKWNLARIAAYEQEFGFVFDPTVRSAEPAPGAPLPLDRRSKTWSAWVQNPYTSAGTRTQDIGWEYNGHDYLIGYWVGRYHGYVH
ncbi:MAG: hypothetical protein KJ052_09760 [Candidatus Hydrogenedentes bacterium]|nr:hypothetical protein [Candidatus Hydrogenedentota bacterium]